MLAAVAPLYHSKTPIGHQPMGHWFSVSTWTEIDSAMLQPSCQASVCLDSFAACSLSSYKCPSHILCMIPGAILVPITASSGLKSPPFNGIAHPGVHRKSTREQWFVFFPSSVLHSSRLRVSVVRGTVCVALFHVASTINSQSNSHIIETNFQPYIVLYLAYVHFNRADVQAEQFGFHTCVIQWR